MAAITWFLAGDDSLWELELAKKKNLFSVQVNPIFA